MKLGIEKINLYAGGLCLDAVALAEARGITRERAVEQLMLGTRSVLPAYEDAVTLAVNAGKRLLADTDRAQVGLLIVATESAVDFGKPVSTWVHRFCELPPNCRNFEIKHACYGGTAAMRMATAWLETEAAKGKKALSSARITPGRTSMISSTSPAGPAPWPCSSVMPRRSSRSTLRAPATGRMKSRTPSGRPRAPRWSTAR